jgi:hypothetical protein
MVTIQPWDTVARAGRARVNVVVALTASTWPPAVPIVVLLEMVDSVPDALKVVVFTWAVVAIRVELSDASGVGAVGEPVSDGSNGAHSASYRRHWCGRGSDVA